MERYFGVMITFGPAAGVFLQYFTRDATLQAIEHFNQKVTLPGATQALRVDPAIDGSGGKLFVGMVPKRATVRFASQIKSRSCVDCASHDKHHCTH